ncbi:MAG: iron complex outerrane recepter protein [Sphingomonadales bacterium]|jgi:iron complex outermembrane receptor protein|nr:iron complex outerrane recepter protein [Sphingomonadales bacterium]
MTSFISHARALTVATTALATGLILVAAPAAAQGEQPAPPPPGSAPQGSPPVNPAPEGAAPVVAGATTSPDSAEPPAPGGNEAPEIVVTGSSLPTTPDQVAVPVSIINAEAITRGGVGNNALELVRKQVPGFAGRSNTGNSNANNTNQNTAGGSQAQLRNLDTLVLINGRRAAVNAIAGLGGKVFVDLSQIPVAAIERVEVLTDGASAIYGSDAVGGVINFILKSDYEGGSADVRYAGAAGGYRERSANITVGHNFRPWLNVTMSGSYMKSDPLYQNQRSFTSPFFSTATAVPGSVVTGGFFGVLAPTLTSPSQRNPTGLLATAPNFAALIANGTYVNTPTQTSPQTSPATANSNIAITGTGIGGTYDLSQFQTILLQQEQKAFSGSVTARIIGNDLIFFADTQLADNHSFTQFRPVTAGVTLPQGAPFNPVAGALAGVTFGSTANPKQYFNHNESLRITAGFKGNLPFIGPRWSFETAYVHSVNTLTQQQRNVIYTPNVARAIAGGFDANGNAVAGGAFSKVFSGFSLSGPLVLVPALDPLSRTPNPATLAALFGTEILKASSRLDSFDGKITGNLVRLPGGPVAMAIGAGYRRESLSGTPDANGYVHTDPNYCNNGGALTNNPSAWSGGQQADPFPVACSTGAPGSSTPSGRRISSEFLEVRIPITGGDFTLPGFHEFNLIGAVRHEHYSDAGNSTVPKIGFFWQPFDSSLTLRGTYAKSFTAPPLYQEFGPVNFRLAGPGIIPAAFPGLAAGLSPVEDGVNPGLQPAKATSYSLGVVFKPAFVPRLRLEANYSFIRETGLPGGIGFSNIFLDVNQLGSASLFAGNIAKGNFPGMPGATAFANPGDLRAYLAADPANYANVFAIDRFTNLGGIRVRTLNGSIDYSVPTAKSGTLSFNSVIAVFLNYKFQALPSQKFYEYAGTATNGGTGVQGVLPKFRSYTTLNWNYGNFDVTLGNTFISSVRDLGAGGITYETNAGRTPPTAFAGRIKSYTAFDLRLAYTARDLDGHPSGFSIAVGANDVFNRMPPVSTNVFTPSAAYTDNTADVSTYSPLGRLIYVQASVHF